MSEPILDVRALFAGYGATTVLTGIDLSVNAGETAVVIGPNGHGKTTLLRAISSLVKSTKGEVVFEGEAIQSRSPEFTAQLGIVHVPQGDGLFAEMTVEDNVLMGAFIASSWKERRASLERVYEIFPGVKERSDQRARTLSGGERRLTALARALMRPSKLLMIDEPSLGLAPVAIDAVYEAIAGLKAASTTILLVEENFTHVDRVADVVHVLEMGTIVRSGPYDELSHDATVINTYLGEV
jgi:branched-chain amino acid transport system ATP-binding protein